MVRSACVLKKLSAGKESSLFPVLASFLKPMLPYFGSDYCWVFSLPLCVRLPQKEPGSRLGKQFAGFQKPENGIDLVLATSIVFLSVVDESCLNSGLIY